MNNQIVFASIVYSTRSSETDALLLAESIRAFAGKLAHQPTWFFTPQIGKQLSKAFLERLQPLKIEIIPFEASPEVLRFPLAGDVLAAAQAEEAASRDDILVWLGANTIILKEPGAFVLESGKDIGYRPVHHTNIGSPYDRPPDPFWDLIYQTCQIPPDHIFPMRTHVDGATVRPYFNASSLAVRPEKCLFQRWQETFLACYHQPAFEDFYRQDQPYAIFMHQAILAGIILASLNPSRMQELPPSYNYPLHLYADDVTSQRPAGLEELVTLRHECFYHDLDWFTKMPAQESLKQWIKDRLL